MNSLPLFLTIGIFLALSIGVSCLTYSTSGDGGEVCGSEGLKCLNNEAVCNGGRCECTRTRYPNGRGQLNCYRNSEFNTEVVNDPILRTMNNKSVDLPIPCRYLLSHFTTGLENRQRNTIGNCTFKVHVFHGKDKGKFYVAGFDVAFQLDYDNGNQYKGSLRQLGKADDGTYTYESLGTEGQFLPDGPWGSDDLDYTDTANKIKVRQYRDEEDNIAILKITKCGVRFRLRGYDSTLRRNQTMVPGMSLSVSRAFPPVDFLSENESMALIPVEKPNGFDLSSILIDGLGRSGTMVYRALTSNVEQNQPHPNPQCAASSDILTACANDGDKLKDAFDNCLWMLKSPRFIRCFDSTMSGEHIMGLFNNCTSVYCSDTSCASVIGMITGSGCDHVSGYDNLDSFVLGTMCPPAIGRRRRRRRR